MVKHDNSRDEYGLTRTQRRTLNHMAQGLSNHEIAKLQGVSVQAIKNYTSAIYEVLGMIQGEQRVKAVLWALMHGYPK